MILSRERGGIIRNMRFVKSLVGFLFVSLFIFKIFVLPVFSEDQLDIINRQIGELTQALQMSVAATRPLESQLNSLKKQLSDIKARVKTIEDDLIVKKNEIDKGYKKLDEQQVVLNKAIRDYYIAGYYNFPYLVLLSQSSANEVTQFLAYQRAKTDENKRIITNLSLLLEDLEKRKKNLEDEEERLAGLKSKLDEQAGQLDKIVGGAKAYQAKLSSQIAQLNAQQQELVAQRLGNLNIPRSAATSMPACVDDREKDPGFSPRIAFFTYGVPNRTGLNQYGADGRGKAGQNVEQILQAYYTSFELKKDYSTSININVDGYGGYNIEEYVKRIYEMPSSFHPEALKAQAVAARSYALAYTNNGQGSICATQTCQVFKPDPKGGAWEEAVNATRGWVMVQGGNPIKAWYSSTHGGYVFPTSELPGWSATSWTKRAIDTTTGTAGGFGDLNVNAYDKDSPWFYCDWGSRSQYNKTAWLKPQELADIVNIILLARADSSTKDHFYQTDKPHPYGGEVWNEERVKSELRSRNITPHDNISDISVSADFGSGKTTSVNIGGMSFDGSEFKDWFNLRAPANIQIVGPLYNIERR